MAAAADEFLRDYPPAERSQLADRARRKRETARRLREYLIDAKDIERGTLVPYSKIASEHGSISTGGSSYSYRFQYAGHDYLVDDAYCPNPGCDCREAYLWFFEYKPNQDPEGDDLLAQSFLAKVSLKTKRVEIENRLRTPGDEAEKSVAAWWDHFGAAELNELKWRYKKVKEIARRSPHRTTPRLPAATVSPAAVPAGASLFRDSWSLSAAPPAARPGRNDPCPCGSGKKYKKCCGR